MAFAINQNFDLKSKRKDFVRQELTLEQLKTTRDADYPDDYQVVIGGKIYIFNSANPVDPTLGKWKEFKSGIDVKAGAGLTMDTGGTMSVKVSSGLRIDEGQCVALKCGGGVTIDSANQLTIQTKGAIHIDPSDRALTLSSSQTFVYGAEGAVIASPADIRIGSRTVISGAQGVYVGTKVDYSPTDSSHTIAGLAVASNVRIGFGLATSVVMDAFDPTLPVVIGTGVQIGNGVRIDDSAHIGGGVSIPEHTRIAQVGNSISINGILLASAIDGEGGGGSALRVGSGMVFLEGAGLQLQISSMVSSTAISGDITTGGSTRCGLCFRGNALSLKLVDEQIVDPGTDKVCIHGKSGLKLTSNGLDIDIPTLAAALIPHLPFK